MFYRRHIALFTFSLVHQISSYKANKGSYLMMIPLHLPCCRWFLHFLYGVDIYPCCGMGEYFIYYHGTFSYISVPHTIKAIWIQLYNCITQTYQTNYIRFTCNSHHNGWISSPLFCLRELCGYTVFIAINLTKDPYLNGVFMDHYK